jgi:hypothetical protein
MISEVLLTDTTLEIVSRACIGRFNFFIELSVLAE